LGLAAGSDSDSFTDPTRRWPITTDDDTIRLHPGHWAQLASFERHGPLLNHLPLVDRLTRPTPANTQFGPSIQLTGYQFGNQPPTPGSTLPVVLEWTASQPLTTDYTVFIHLISPDGALVAQSDAYPTWLTAQPTSQWPVNQPILDSHALTLPPNLLPGLYTLQVGLYNAQTLKRLPLPNGNDTFETQLKINN